MRRRLAIVPAVAAVLAQSEAFAAPSSPTNAHLGAHTILSTFRGTDANGRAV
jgi:hypothetical protein